MINGCFALNVAAIEGETSGGSIERYPEMLEDLGSNRLPSPYRLLRKLG